MGKFIDLKGTSQTSFQIGLSGPRVKNESGVVAARNAADGAYADLLGDILRAANNSIILNNDAAGSGADWLYTISRPSTGMTAAVTLTLPPDAGSSGQVLSTDGSGNTSWVTPSGSNALLAVEYALDYDDSSGQLTFFTLPIANIITEVSVQIVTQFDTAATVSVGVVGTVDKYMTTTENDLQGTVGDRYEANPNEQALGVTEAVTLNYTPNSATAGAARVRVVYCYPA